MDEEIAASTNTRAALRKSFDSEQKRTQARFLRSGDGLRAIRARAGLVDSLLQGLWADTIKANHDVSLVALGGYGRGELFPRSDIDLLFLCNSRGAERKYNDQIAAFCQELWDLRLKLGATTRTLTECDRVVDGNLEFTIALLDCRFVAGDRLLFENLHGEVLPRLGMREGDSIVRNLAELTRQRHAKYGDTVFHLEPNLKNGPGGLRDHNVASWLSLLAQMRKSKRWAGDEQNAEEAVGAAFNFISAARCFLHYRDGRDQNVLSYEAQSELAAAGVGNRGNEMEPEEWMRAYFRHARVLRRRTSQMLAEAAPAQSSLYTSFENWRSRLSNADFSVVGERVFVRRPAELRQASMMLALFEFVARHGINPDAETERRVAKAAPRVDWSGGEVWPRFLVIVGLPHSHTALRAMHACGVLTRMVPEFEAIDALVIRDYFHRYTVDEHTFTAIENLNRLRKRESELKVRFAGLLESVERPELLIFALLFHDLGKGSSENDHVAGGLRMLAPVMERARLPESDGKTVEFLIAMHLEMSAVLQRRDIYDPATVRAFAARIGAPERLKMLTLLTYADIKAVNEDTLPSWKAENLWQLYVAAANVLDRGIDEERWHVGESPFPVAENADLQHFLDGFPKRYVVAHSTPEIKEHYEMARRLAGVPVQVRLRSEGNLYELTVVTGDRGGLFATIAGVLAAWGMNIVKAEAFANDSGVVLDTFRFLDMFRTLQMNPAEVARFERSIREAISGGLNVDELLKARMRGHVRRRSNAKVTPQIVFYEEDYVHTTLLEVIGEDRPGLLYSISSAIAELGCSVDVALVHTEGPKAVDVFYLSRNGAKLNRGEQDQLRDVLLTELTPGESGFGAGSVS